MVPLATLCALFEYNYWARDRQLEASAALSQEQFLRPMGNSFSSLRDTLAHLVAAEWIWLERWRGRSPAALPSAEAFPTLARFEERVREADPDMREYLPALKHTDLPPPPTPQ